ncbi:MAG: hypothetical protein HFE77_03280 [Clostridiales bacterium]|nr:hypothetical protein [Clostridiales bacterium]
MNTKVKKTVVTIFRIISAFCDAACINYLLTYIFDLCHPSHSGFSPTNIYLAFIVSLAIVIGLYKEKFILWRYCTYGAILFLYIILASANISIPVALWFTIMNCIYLLPGIAITIGIKISTKKKIQAENNSVKPQIDIDSVKNDENGKEEPLSTPESSLCDTMNEKADLENIEQKEGIVPMAAPKSTKRFCKQCGSEIDSNTKICAGCGKHYFRTKNVLKKIPVIVLSLLLCVSIAVNVLSIMEYKKQLSSIQIYETRISSLKKLVSEYQDKANKLQKEIDKATATTESTPTSREGLADSGEFDTVSAFKTAVERNPTTMKNTIVTVNCYIVRTSSVICGVDRDDIDTASRWMLTSGDIPPLLAPSISITMRDDTQNRVVDEDYVKLTGIYTGGKIIDATYEMIEAAD